VCVCVCVCVFVLLCIVKANFGLHASEKTVNSLCKKYKYSIFYKLKSEQAFIM